MSRRAFGFDGGFELGFAIFLNAANRERCFA
jgi:hypothetical protein